jgi:hypothetical protein
MNHASTPCCTLALLLSVSSGALASHSGASGSDFGSRITGASDISVDNQIAVMPLPMNRFLSGQFEAGVSAGYSSVEAGPFTFKGPLLSLAVSYSPFDRFGVYAVGFTNRLDASGGGRDTLVVPFSANVPLDLPAQAQFSNISGSIKQTGVGVSLVYDPFAQRGAEQGTSVQLYLGVLWDRIEHDGVSVDYRVLDGANAGATGSIRYNGTYDFVMPMAGVKFPMRLGPLYVVPNIVGFFPLDDAGQKGTITGSFGSISGDSDSAGNDDANLGRPLGSFGLTLEYVPWGLSTNIGATLFKSLSPDLVDEIDKVVLFNLNKTFGGPDSKP